MITARMERRIWSGIGFLLNRRLSLILRKEERGLATAIAKGIEQAQADIIAVMDTDFNHHPKDLPRLLEKIPEADMVIGSRYISGGGMKTSRFRYLGSWVFNIFIRLVLGSPIKDNLSGFLVFKKRGGWLRLKNKAIFYGYGDYCIRLIHFARKAGFVIREVPVVYEFRLGGESKTNFIKYLIKLYQSRSGLTIRKLKGCFKKRVRDFRIPVYRIFFIAFHLNESLNPGSFQFVD